MRVSSLYLAGKNLSEIEQETGVDIVTVCRDLGALTAEWQKLSVENISRLKAIELIRLEAVERTYWKAYERSCKPKKKSVVSITPNGQTAATQTEDRDEGDPRFLDGVLKCITKRMEILHIIDVPIEMHTEVNQRTSIVVQLQQMGSDDRRRFISNQLADLERLDRLTRLGSRAEPATPSNSELPRGSVGSGEQVNPGALDEVAAGNGLGRLAGDSSGSNSQS